MSILSEILAQFRQSLAQLAAGRVTLLVAIEAVEAAVDDLRAATAGTNDYDILRTLDQLATVPD